MAHNPTNKFDAEVIIEHASLYVPPQTAEESGKHTNPPTLILALRTLQYYNRKPILFTQGFETTTASRSRYRLLLTALGETSFVEPDVLVHRITGKRFSATLQIRFEKRVGPYIAITDFSKSQRSHCRDKRSVRNDNVNFKGHLLAPGWGSALKPPDVASAPPPGKPTSSEGHSFIGVTPHEGETERAGPLPPDDIEKRLDAANSQDELEPEEVEIARNLILAASKLIALTVLDEWCSQVTRRDQNRLRNFNLLWLRHREFLSGREIEDHTGIKTKSAYRQAQDAENVLSEAQHYDIEQTAKLLIKEVNSYGTQQ